MSVTAHQPAIAELLGRCGGRGEVMLVSPADAERPHHFYAGITRPPVLSMLDALLLVLGGRLPDGSRRYEEIVVVSAGLKYNANGKDCPQDELLQLPGEPGATIVRGDTWGTWWYRRPALPAVAATPSPTPALAIRPVPLARPEVSLRYERFEIEIPGDSGAKFPNRHQGLRDVIGRLQRRPHRSLLLVNLAVLDYASPEAVEADVVEGHAQLHEVGIRDMQWLSQFINDVDQRERSRVDVVLYSRNSDRVNAFLTSGLPQRPARWTGAWQQVAYEGHRLPHVQLPCGQFPWGNLFSHDDGFGPDDGTSRSTVEAQRRYHWRTLRSLLRGRSATGDRVTRLRAGNVAPAAPVVAGHSEGLDAAYWAQIDVDAVEAAFRRRYFVSESIACQATTQPRPERSLVDNLFATMRILSRLARTNPRELRTERVAKEWRTASTFLLFGAAGTGKTLLGQLLAPLLFGHDAHVVQCGQIGSGGVGDPAAHLKYSIFGAAHPYAGADRLTPTGTHLAQHHGFTVVIFDELEKAIPGDHQTVFFPLYELLERRVYAPANGHRPIHLMNSVVIVTSNISAWPPPGMSPENQGAIERRVLPWRYGAFSTAQMRQCAEWVMVNHVQQQLQQTAVCYCSRPLPQLDHLPLSASMPASVVADLANRGYLDRLDRAVTEAGITSANAPAFLDVAPILEAALARTA